MGKILGAYLLPHPPILLKEIGRGEEKKAQRTIHGMQEVAKDIRQKEPGVIILITPHGPVFQDAIAILAREELKGDFSNLEQGSSFVKKNHLELVERIKEYAHDEGIWCALVDSDIEKQYHISSDLDHGAMVPLYFIDQEYTDYQIVHITYGLLLGEELYQFGICIQKAIQDVQEDAVVIASGDLSHRLTKDAPAGYHPKGKDFDETLIRSLAEWKIERLFSLPELYRDAGNVDCVLSRSCWSCDGCSTAEILSYERIFSVDMKVMQRLGSNFMIAENVFPIEKDAWNNGRRSELLKMNMSSWHERL